MGLNWEPGGVFHEDQARAAPATVSGVFAS